MLEAASEAATYKRVLLGENELLGAECSWGGICSACASGTLGEAQALLRCAHHLSMDGRNCFKDPGLDARSYCMLAGVKDRRPLGEASNELF